MGKLHTFCCFSHFCLCLQQLLLRQKRHDVFLHFVLIFRYSVLCCIKRTAVFSKSCLHEICGNSKYCTFRHVYYRHAKSKSFCNQTCKPLFIPLTSKACIHLAYYVYSHCLSPSFLWSSWQSTCLQQLMICEAIFLSDKRLRRHGAKFSSHLLWVTKAMLKYFTLKTT